MVSFQQDRNTQNHLQQNNYSASKVALNKINGYFIDYTYIRGSINLTAELSVHDDTEQNTLTSCSASDTCPKHLLSP